MNNKIKIDKIPIRLLDGGDVASEENSLSLGIHQYVIG